MFFLTSIFGWKTILIGIMSLVVYGACSFQSFKNKLREEGYQKCIRQIEKSAEKNVKKRLRDHDRQKKLDKKEIDKIKKTGDIEKILD